jgi:peptidyl-prolyl cis-trans isomerase D
VGPDRGSEGRRGLNGKRPLSAVFRGKPPPCSRRRQFLAPAGGPFYYPRRQIRRADAPYTEVLMLDSLRKGATSWVAQIFIVLLVLSFAVWGISDIFRGFRSNSVAQVGSTNVSIEDFARQYDFALRQVSQQMGQQITRDQAQAFGLPAQVLDRVVRDATLDNTARELGLGISNEALGRQIVQDPTFKGSGDAFDRVTFNQLIRNAGFTERQYVETRRLDAVRGQIIDAFAGGAAAPDAYLRALHEYRTEERSIGYVVLTAAEAGTVGEPADADLQTYFDAHKADWKAPEYRAVTIVRMTPTDLAKPDDISDEEAKKSYDAALDKYTTPEKRHIKQIVFSNLDEGQKAADELAAGKTFEDLVAERKLTDSDVDLGTITKDHFADLKVSETAFSLPAGAVSGLIDGQFGPVILKVEAIEPQVVKTFDEVKADLKKQIAESRAAQEISDQHDMIEDARAGGSTLGEIAQKYGLKVITIPAIDAGGKDEAGNPVADIPGGGDLVAQAFQSDVGIENDPISIDNRSGYVWFEVTDVKPSRDRTLDEVKDKVIAAWKKQKADEAVEAKAKEIRDRIAKGEDLATVAGQLSLAYKTADKLVRSAPASDDLSIDAIKAVFEGPKGHVAVAPGAADGSQVVLVVTDTSVPDYVAGTDEDKQIKKQLSAQISNDLLTQYVTQSQAAVGVSINQAAVQAVIGRSGS